MNIDCVTYLCNCTYVNVYVSNLSTIICKQTAPNTRLMDLIYNS